MYYSKYKSTKISYMMKGNAEANPPANPPANAEEKTTVLQGINYESGKIIDHITKSKNCVCYANIQIAMDAPFGGDDRIADESVRKEGRSELHFNKDADKLITSTFKRVIGHLITNYSTVSALVIQVARGRSAGPMISDVLQPVINDFSSNKKIDFNFRNIIWATGYRTKDYFDHTVIHTDFIFINVGMFGVLNNLRSTIPGTIFNPIRSYSLTTTDKETKKYEHFTLSSPKHYTTKDNILNDMKDINPVILYGIDDAMKFVTPDSYNKEKLLATLMSIKR